MARQLTVQENKLHCCKGVTCDELRDFFVPVYGTLHRAVGCVVCDIYVCAVVGSKHASKHTAPSIMPPILKQADLKQIELTGQTDFNKQQVG